MISLPLSIKIAADIIIKSDLLGAVGAEYFEAAADDILSIVSVLIERQFDIEVIYEIAESFIKDRYNAIM